MLADFTGHGLSAAIGALPVADTFCVMTEKGFRPEVIIRQINRKLYTLLPTSMFMSMALVQVTPDLDEVHVWNAGMPHIYLVDGRGGGIKGMVQSSSLPLGVIEHIDEALHEDILGVEDGDCFVLHSDGMTECVNTSGEMYGVERLETTLNSLAGSDDVFNSVMADFDSFCGVQALADDVSLVTIPCVASLFETPQQDLVVNDHVNHNHCGSWRWAMELSGASMHDVDLVPVIISEYSKLLSQPVEVMDLHNVLTELYRNAVEHGAFRSARKKLEREHRCNRDDETNVNLLDGSFVRVELEIIRHEDRPAVYIKVEDSGRGFDHARIMRSIDEDAVDVSSGYGLTLVKSICDSLRFNESGNCIEAIISGEAAV